MVAGFVLVVSYLFFSFFFVGGGRRVGEEGLL